MLTAENFSSVKKRRKILPAGAMKRNSGCNLYSLDRSYRFFCSATGRWLVADEVAYDEKLSSFQSVKEFSRAVRPRSGQKQEVNFWPQLGVGETRYQTLTSVPTAAHNNPAAAFVYADDSRVVQKRPAPEQQQQHVPQQQQPMAPPPMGSMPHPGQMLPPHMAQQAQPVPVQLHLDTATTKDGDTLFGGSQADGATEHGESIFGDDVCGVYKCRAFLGSSFWARLMRGSGSFTIFFFLKHITQKSTLFGGDGATEMGSQIDHEEMHERERQQAERIKKVMEQAKVQRYERLLCNLPSCSSGLIRVIFSECHYPPDNPLQSRAP